ncbi:MAG TPA: 4-(cytidine 5'-diphospho)-2-C-methyl-D-erythritol kinase [Rhodanobacteraceae bacterium]|nr:4-(cytidine 5'-diphospho)-2-C-methyl-D-erythritol kinase [Rhodanobacteraceae bacterium]
MSWSTWPAPAKLNLFLHITGQREDGYHCLETVFRLLDWGDTVHLRLRADADIRRANDVPGVLPDDDLTVRAARLLRRQSTQALPGVDITVDKRIPMGGGLGGGSSDAATVLVALNCLWQLDLDSDALAALGLQLGADVPLFVRGRSAWAEGVGEQLTALDLPRCSYVIVNPHASVSTAELFRAPELTRHAAPATIRAFLRGEVTGNAFAPVVRKRCPPVAAALDWLDRFGSARLSGSGGCVFLETATRAEAERVAAQCPPAFSAFVADGVNVSALSAAVEKFGSSRDNAPAGV